MKSESCDPVEVGYLASALDVSGPAFALRLPSNASSLPRLPGAAQGHFRHYVLSNTSAFPVHDVFVLHREGNTLFVFEAPSIPAGASAGFALEEHRVADQNASTRIALRNRLVALRSEDSTCVMGRDPAKPAESASGHTLFAEEAEALLRVWGTALFDQPGTTIVYREDRAYLDQAMPLSLFTDMFHWVELHRAGLALWQGGRFAMNRRRRTHSNGVRKGVCLVPQMERLVISRSRINPRSPRCPVA